LVMTEKNKDSAMIPPGWGKDELTQYFDAARDNMFASFVNLRDRYNQILQVDRIWKKGTDYMDNIKEPVESFLFFRAHSCFRTATRISMSGQISEVTSVLRTCLEYALFALRMNRKPELQEVWLKRQETEENRRLVRKEFGISNLFKTLEDAHAYTHKEASRIYDLLIDYGAHPNPMGMAAGMGIQENEENEDQRRYLSYYLGVSPHFVKVAMVLTARVGMLVLMIYLRIFSERFEIIGLGDEIRKLRI
jgi:hypothetical protein